MLISIVSRIVSGRCNVMECIHEILAGGRCNMMVCTCKILAGGGQLGQVRSVVIKISFGREGVT